MSKPAVLVILVSLNFLEIGAVSLKGQSNKPQSQQKRQGSTAPTVTLPPAPHPSAASSYTPRWRGTEEELNALRARIREGVRSKEGHDIDLSSTVISSANQNEIVVGKILGDSDNIEEINIDTDPCKGKEITHFKRPFRKDATGSTVTCEGTTYDIFAVEQEK